jgi:tetratricopeptide (TPR) repeat protein
VLSLWLAGASLAAPPPLPPYDDVLARTAWRRINHLLELGCTWNPELQGITCVDGAAAGVVAEVDAFSGTVFADGPLEYLAGLAEKYQGHDGAAEGRYRRALELDPTLVEAWYDLGEILLASGRFDGAREAFTEVSNRATAPATRWLGPWRLAEIAAHEHDARAFEEHLTEALRRGFSFRTIAGLPNWRAFAADPAIGPTLDGLLVVYGDPAIRDSLKTP